MSDSLALRIRRPVGRLRIMSYIEGISLLLLVVVAVPLKYAAGQPELVKILGPIHGVTFLIYCLWLIQCAIGGRWMIIESLKYFVASLIPLGFVWIRKDLAKKDAAWPAEAKA